MSNLITNFKFQIPVHCKNSLNYSAPRSQAPALIVISQNDMNCRVDKAERIHRISAKMVDTLSLYPPYTMSLYFKYLNTYV
jgi:predicted alpha/beta hydrolase family esterase